MEIIMSEDIETVDSSLKAMEFDGDNNNDEVMTTLWICQM